MQHDDSFLVGNSKLKKVDLSESAKSWAEYLFDEYMVEKQNRHKTDNIKEMVKPTYHEDSV